MWMDLESAVCAGRVELLPDSSSQAPLNDGKDGLEGRATDGRPYMGLRGWGVRGV